MRGPQNAMLWSEKLFRSVCVGTFIFSPRARISAQCTAKYLCVNRRLAWNALSSSQNNKVAHWVRPHWPLFCVISLMLFKYTERFGQNKREHKHRARQKRNKMWTRAKLSHRQNFMWLAWSVRRHIFDEPHFICNALTAIAAVRIHRYAPSYLQSCANVIIKKSDAECLK